MKTSFYLVLWIILEFIFLHIENYFVPVFISRVFFEIDIVIVLILYWIFNNSSSSQQYCLYETKLRRLKNFGHEKLHNNFRSKRSIRLSYSLNILLIIFYCFSAIFIAWTLYHVNASDWWGHIDWIGLIVYLFFTCRIVSKSIGNINFLRQSYQTHTIDASNLEEYKIQLSNHVPKKFIFYQRINIVSSIISIIFGIIIFSSAIYLFLTHCEQRAIGIACIFYIYGSLAIFYGLTDLATVIQNNRIKRLLTKSQIMNSI